MIDNFYKKIGFLKELRLDGKIKNQLRAELVLYLKYHPVRNSPWERLLYQRSFLAIILNKNKLKTMPVIILIIALVAGGSVSVAAENTLPGDLLYPVKVGVNEGVRELFAVSAKAEVELQAKLAERRLKEAAQLAAENRLDAETRMDIESRFKNHSEKANKNLAKLDVEEKSQAAAGVSSSLEARLRAQQRVLEDINQRATVEIMTELKPIIFEVREEIQKTMDARLKAEAQFTTSAAPEVKTAAEGKLKASRNKVAEVRGFLDKRGERFDAQAKAETEAQLKVADDLIVKGEAEIEAGNYSEAFRLAQSALRAAQEAQSKAQTRSIIEVRLGLPNVRVETKTEIETESKSNDDKTSEDNSGNDVNVEVETETSSEIRNDSGRTGNEVRGDATIKIGL